MISVQLKCHGGYNKDDDDDDDDYHDYDDNDGNIGLCLHKMSKLEIFSSA